MDFLRLLLWLWKEAGRRVNPYAVEDRAEQIKELKLHFKGKHSD